MNGYVGLRDDRRDGERLAARIGLLFPRGQARVACIDGRWLTSANQAASRG